LAGKGSIAVGYDADITVWDTDKTATLSQQNLHHRADYTPYEGLEITGWPTATMLRGRFVVRDGMLVGSKGDGRYVSRGKPGEPSSASGNTEREKGAIAAGTSPR
jgi:dihydropyrimidinase